MKYTEYNEKIKIYGTKTGVAKVTEILDSVTLTNIEKKDRLIIQKAIDDSSLSNKGQTHVLYLGNNIYSKKIIVTECKKLSKRKTLDGMSDYLYNFLIGPCAEIAHYDKSGFIEYFDNSWARLFSELLKPALSRIPLWWTDVCNILSEVVANAS